VTEPLVILVAYLVGSIPTGLWLGRLTQGVDVRTRGSGRTGATNVQRSLGTRAAAAVLLIDFGKGLVAVLAARALTGNEYVAAAAGLAAVAGHIWPVFAGFRGGRGVATGGGALFALAPLATGIALAVFVALVALTRYVSLGSVVGALLVAVVVALLRGRTPQSEAALPLAVIVGALIVVKHIDNIQRLVRGTESRIGSHKGGA
jgi:glycerol-3-phosphate acyltransferase PlsY